MAGRDFKKIRAWQLADKLVLAIYEATAESFPVEERYCLTQQLRRAIISVAANIAEGSGRQYLKEFLHFLYQAYGSLQETEYYLHLARELGYLSEPKFHQLEEMRRVTGATLSNLIKNVKRQMSKGLIYNAPASHQKPEASS